MADTGFPDLFSSAEESERGARSGPLAHRMRPQTLDDFIGQEKILGPGKPLRQWIENDRVPSLILWGPPGCGKTTLGKIIAAKTKARFESLSAVLSGVKDIKESVERAKQAFRLNRAKTILFVDEIHRFNKSQQDALLPHVEDGTVTLIGATTENPSFELNRALLSRARVMRLENLSADAVETILRRALEDSERGLGGFLKLSDESIRWLAETNEGDARRALTALETVALFSATMPVDAASTKALPSKMSSSEEGSIDSSTAASITTSTGSTERAPLTLEQTQASLESALERQPIPYDKVGDEHYSIISAFIKSIRDSDPHAALYYLARMIEGGEDPTFIARRLVISASEDVGNADPRALQVALNAKEAVEFIGWPEGRINLAQAVTYLALAPKSNAAYMGIEAALAEVRASGALPVPMHIRSAPNAFMKAQGYGKGYQYAHDAGAQRVKQTHLPDELIGKRFYHPKEVGLEIQLKEKLDRINPDFE